MLRVREELAAGKLVDWDAAAFRRLSLSVAARAKVRPEDSLHGAIALHSVVLRPISPSLRVVDGAALDPAHTRTSPARDMSAADR
jgi:hypothetical protein